uniref:Uncharacterized protein n=1 Tax=Aegilops tauschii subsp. strangulata TaxID=200361 RepID=A0A453RQA0_AEGTS
DVCFVFRSWQHHQRIRGRERDGEATRPGSGNKWERAAGSLAAWQALSVASFPYLNSLPSFPFLHHSPLPQKAASVRPRPPHPHHHRTRRQAKNLTHRARLHTSQLPLDAAGSRQQLDQAAAPRHRRRAGAWVLPRRVVKAQNFHACRGDSGVESRSRARQPRSMDLGAWRDSL